MSVDNKATYAHAASTQLVLHRHDDLCNFWSVVVHALHANGHSGLLLLLWTHIDEFCCYKHHLQYSSCMPLLPFANIAGMRDVVSDIL